MRYAQGGGLTTERRMFRERLRFAAAQAFARGEDTKTVAADLRVSVRSVQRWRRAWVAGGRAGLRSKGPGSRPVLSDEQFAILEHELARGPVEHGWPDQRWTLARITTVIGRRFHVSYSLKGLSLLLHRHGWSPQVPARRAVERGEAAVASWVKNTWPQVKGHGRRSMGGWSSKTRPASQLRPPTARTWGPRGVTPVIRVRGRTTRRVSIAALACYRPGHRSRVIYRPYRHDRNSSTRKSFAWTDYRDLLADAHRQLPGGRIVLVWDNLNTHLTAGLRAWIARQDWLTVYQLPAYAPDLNPVEGLWSVIRRGPIANRIITDPDHLLRIVRTSLRRIQWRPTLINGCLTATTLSTS